LEKNMMITSSLLAFSVSQQCCYEHYQQFKFCPSSVQSFKD